MSHGPWKKGSDASLAIRDDCDGGTLCAVVSKRVWEWAKVPAVGALLAPVRRTVAVDALNHHAPWRGYWIGAAIQHVDNRAVGLPSQGGRNVTGGLDYREGIRPDASPELAKQGPTTRVARSEVRGEDEAGDNGNTTDPYLARGDRRRSDITLDQLVAVLEWDLLDSTDQTDRRQWPTDRRCGSLDGQEVGARPHDCPRVGSRRRSSTLAKERDG